ncbi:cobaltochelatase subunit CobN [Desulfurococcaceae archaeon MEX13E-LK6-19]|nr:cobaltochelatase subunit CobN [Desulfurococcaceae archaeon MEX13E-LK6-19]
MMAPRREKADKVIEVLKYAVQVARLIRECRRETTSLIDGLAGSYIEPGASGALTRGKIEVLPTGRNFYLIDPRTLPTKAAWIVGRDSAEKLLRHYLEKHGRYPESVGEVLWSIDAYKADGEQLAQILYLIGVEPVWDGNGVVRDLRVIPLEELGRPRIDVVVRISGIVRDTLPNYIELIDKAVAKVIALDEPLDKNYVKKHYLENMKKLVELGVEPRRAEKMARYRVYGAPPGAYGAGVNLAVEASAWKTDMDLAKIWIQWSGYAYGIDSYGEPAHEALVLSLERVDVVNRNHVSDEHDIFGCCCYFAYHGGFYNAVKALTKRSDIEIVTVDTRDISSVEVRDMDLEIERITRAKLLNREWINEMKKHGYRGANEFQRKILHLYGWASTTRMVPDWVFQEIAETYVLDEEMKKWFMEHNVWALEEITRRLIEAALRGLWKPSRELLDKLRKTHTEIEGFLEEDITTPGEVQGGYIDVVMPDQVSSWSKSIERIETIIKRFKEITGK